MFFTPQGTDSAECSQIYNATVGLKLHLLDIVNIIKSQMINDYLTVVLSRLPSVCGILRITLVLRGA